MWFNFYFILKLDYFFLLNVFFIFSESLYGKNLFYFEHRLKDLFRSCHELQLTYLMVLEKHVVFDLTEKEEQDVLTSGKYVW